MSINVLRFVRSDYIRKNSGAITPTDSYFSNIAILLRANPNFTGSASDPIYPYSSSGVTFPTAIFHDSTSPTQSVGQYYARYGNSISVAVPYSPYSSAYPSTDGVYIMQGNTGTTNAFSNPTAITTSDSGVQSGTAPTTLEIAAAGDVVGDMHRTLLSNSAKSTAIANGFTVEFWVEIPAGSFSSSTSLVGVSGDITFTLLANKTITVNWKPCAFSLGPYYDGADTTAYYIDYYTAVTQTTSTLSPGWHHIAFTCSYQAIIGTNSGSVNLYVDGSRVAQDLNKQIPSTVSGTTTYNTIPNNNNSPATYSNRPLVIRSPSNFYCFNASPFPLTGIRIILGNCLSTAANFTPPTQKVTSNIIGWNGSTSTFTYTYCWISHFTTWGNDTKTINYAYKNYKISMAYSTYLSNSYGTPSLVTVSSTIPTVSNSVYSTGVQSLSFTGQANGNLGFFRNSYQTSSEGAVDLVGNDFTVNFFMQRTSGTGVDVLWNNAVSSGAGTIALYITSANQLALRVGTSTTTARITTSTISNNVWYYVQLSRSSTTFTLSSVASGGSVTSGTYTTTAIPTQSTTATTSYSAPNLAFNIGGDSSVTAANAFYGLIADYRLTLGIARGTPSGYPTYFSPTTA